MTMQAVWQRWKELTRFRLASEMALSAYRNSFVDLPIRDISLTKIYDERGRTRFECSYSEFLAALNDESYLYQLLLIAHASLVEEFGRTVVAQILDEGFLARSAFPGLQLSTPVAEAVETYIMSTNVESWGKALLAVGGRSWDIVPGGAGDLVHAFVVRNILAHGAMTYNLRAINRLNGVAPGRFRFVEGDRLVLDRESFQLHLSRLRNFSRVICGLPSRIRRRSHSVS